MSFSAYSATKEPVEQSDNTVIVHMSSAYFQETPRMPQFIAGRGSFVSQWRSAHTEGCHKIYRTCLNVNNPFSGSVSDSTMQACQNFAVER